MPEKRLLTTAPDSNPPESVLRSDEARMSTFEFPASDLDPVVGDLATLAGFLTRPDDKTLRVNAAWFEHPVDELSAIASTPDRWQAIQMLLEALFGELSADALGSPVEHANRHWYPIHLPGEESGATRESSGLYIVVEPDADKPADQTRLSVGLGLLRPIVPGDQGDDHAITITPYAYLPIFQLQKDHTEPVLILGAPSFPVELGIDVIDAKGHFGTEKVHFDGLEVLASLDFSKGVRPDLDIVLLNLDLPGKPVADRSLHDLEELPIRDWINTVVALLADQLPQSKETSAMLGALTTLLGLQGDVPSIDWDKLVHNPEEAAQILRQWFVSILADDKTTRTWLEAWQTLFVGSTSSQVAGSGTRRMPWRVPLLGDSKVAELDLTFAVIRDKEQGTLSFYPGLSLNSPTAHPAPEAAPDLDVNLSCVVELLECTLTPPTTPQIFDAAAALKALPSLGAMVVIANPVGALVEGTDKAQTFSIGSISVGLELDENHSPSPVFCLTDVTTPLGSWDEIDLANFDGKTLDEAISTVVKNAIQAFLNLDHSPSSVARGLAVALGVALPSGVDAENWPALVIDGGELDALVSDPLRALTSFYERALEKQKDDDTVIPRLLSSLAAVGGVVDPSTTGSGTAQSPWRTSLFKDSGGDVDFGLLLSVDADKSETVHLSLDLRSKLSATKQLAVCPRLKVDLLRFDVGQDRGASQWLSGVQAGCIMTGPDDKAVSTSLAEVDIELARAGLSFGWQRQGGIYCAADFDKLQASVDGKEVGHIDSLRYDLSDSTQWKKETLDKLAPFVVTIAGAMTMAHGGRTGVLITTSLGLLPDLPKLYKDAQKGPNPFHLPALTLPDGDAGWPSLSTEALEGFFDDPWSVTKAQLQALIERPPCGEALRRLLGWALTGTLPEDREIPAEFDRTAPLSVELPGLADIELLLWKPGAQITSPMAVGLRRTMQVGKGAGLQVSTEARIDILCEAGSDLIPKYPAGAPCLSLLCHIRPEGDEVLLDTIEGWPISGATLGAYFDTDGVHPVALVETSSANDADLGLPSFSDLLEKAVSSGTRQVLDSVLGGLVDRLNTTLGDHPALNAFFEILGVLGLAKPKDAKEPQAGYVIVPQAWLFLISDPQAFLKRQSDEIVTNLTKARAFLDALARLLGFSGLNPPESLSFLPPLLEGLGLLTQTEVGLMVNTSAWIELVDDPVGYVQKASSAIFTSETRRKALISSLRGAPDDPRLPLYVADGTRIVLQLPSGLPYHVNKYLALNPRLELNLQALSLQARFDLLATEINAQLSFELDVDADAALTWGIFVANRAEPVETLLPPISLYPTFDIAELAHQAAPYVVSAIATPILNSRLVANYPVILRLCDALGLRDTTSSALAVGDPTEAVRTLLPLLYSPRAWLLSEQAFGDGTGKLDLAKMGKSLADVVGKKSLEGPDGLILEAISGTDAPGVRLKWKDYGNLAITASSADGVDLTLTIEAITQPSFEASLSAGITFGRGTGVHPHGDLPLTIIVSDESRIVVDTGYAGDAFSLTVHGKSHGKDFPAKGDPISLIPFAGMQQFLESGSQILLDLVADEIKDAFDNYKAAHPKSELVVFFDGVIEVGPVLGVETLSDLLPQARLIYDDPLKWLQGRIDQKGSLEKMEHFFHDTLGLTSVTAVDSTLQYAISTDFVAMTLSAGTRGSGDDAVFGIWFSPTITAQGWFLGTADVGSAIALPLSSTSDLDFSLGLRTGLDLCSFDIASLSQGPQVSFDFDIDQTGTVNKFSLFVYPVGPATDERKSPLAIELLPKVIVGYGDRNNRCIATPISTPEEYARWFALLSLELLVPMVANSALQTAPVIHWLDAALTSSTEVTAGQILSQWGLLQKRKDSDPVEYTLADLEKTFADKTAAQIVESLFFNALDLLDGVAFVDTKTCTIAVESDKSKEGSTDYGLRLALQDLEVLSSNSADLKVQIGKWLTGDTDDDNWLTRSAGKSAASEKPGLSVYAIRVAGKDASPAFHPRLNLISIGVDVTGHSKPLVDIKGYQLGGVEPRALFCLQPGEKSGVDIQYGVGARLDDFGIPVGPGFVSESASSSGNPVAESLLTSSDGGSGHDGEGGDSSSNAKSPVNPSFSVSTSYADVGDARFDLTLYGADANNMLWVPVQRAFGPLQCRRVGIGTGGDPIDHIKVGFDGNVSLVALQIDLEDLSVGVPIHHPGDFDEYEFDLAGLAVSFDGGPVSISGALLETKDDHITAYSGQVAVKATAFGLAGLASYASFDFSDLEGGGESGTSFFAFAALSAPLGGPPYFFVTGLAAGFGYNRGLVLPGPNDVPKFPLVNAVIAADPAIKSSTPPEEVLADLGKSVPVVPGEYWLAGGIRFTTFEMLDAFALLTASFGDTFELGLLGMATLSLPMGKPIVYAELAIAVEFIPSQGVFSTSAVLTPNSYVFDKSCQLTGGFAFFIWYSGDHAGDFVVTLGGYNPHFHCDHYPEIARIGLDWPIGGGVHIKGGGYFALTPSCVMAGGDLSATYKAGKLKAWFRADANFLIRWQPFHYEFDAHVSVGASYRVDALFVHKTFSVELSAGLQIWGPKFGGKVHVNWWVISFSINFGARRSSSPPDLNWDEFYNSFMPEPKGGAGESEGAFGAEPKKLCCKTTIVDGILRQFRTGDEATNESPFPANSEVWVVNPHELRLNSQTSIPSSRLFVNDIEAGDVDASAVGVRPMGLDKLNADHVIHVQKFDDSGKWENIGMANSSASAELLADPQTQMLYEPVYGGAAKALWDTKPQPKGPPPSQGIVANTLGGTTLRPAPAPFHAVPPFPLALLKPVTGTRKVAWPKIPAPTKPTYSQKDRLRQLQESLMKAKVVSERDQLLAALGAAGLPISIEPSLELMAATAERIFSAPPTIVTLGGVLSPPTRMHRLFANARATTVADVPHEES